VAVPLVTDSVTEARTPVDPLDPPLHLLVWLFTAPTAVMTCVPGDDWAGTIALAENLPMESVLTVGRPLGAPSQLSWIQLREPKFDPSTLSVPPGTGVPIAASDGDAAPTFTNGASSAGTRRTIGIVASQSVRRLGVAMCAPNGVRPSPGSDPDRVDIGSDL
jgi:hypothetical protein